MSVYNIQSFVFIVYIYLYQYEDTCSLFCFAAVLPGAQLCYDCVIGIDDMERADGSVGQ